MKEVKDIILERRINNLEIDGKQVPDKYISVFNSYLEQIAESLADYTKQVRKEVCEEIKKKADIEYYEEYDGFDRKVGKTYIIRDYDLDQIQGETK